MSLARFKPGLLRLFSLVNELAQDPIHKRLLALEIQERLLTRTGRIERTIRNLRDETRRLKRLLTNRHNDRKTSRAIKAKLQRNSDRLDDQRLILEILKAVGDSVAFIYGDRFDMKQFSQHEPAGFLTGKAGTRAERRFLRHVFKEEGLVAILNDLTNSLRHGDITIYQPTKTQTPILVEVKSGTTGSRGRRQIEKNRELAKFLNTDEKIVAGNVVRRVAAPSAPTNLGAEFVRVAKQALKSGYATEEVEPGVIYHVVTAKKADAALNEALDALPVVKSGMYGFVSAALHGSEGHYPVPLSIADPEVLYQLYSRDLFGFILVDLDALNEKLAPAGLSARLTKQDDLPMEIVALDGNVGAYAKFLVGSHFMGRLFTEFITLEWFAEAIANHIQGLAADNNATLLG